MLRAPVALVVQLQLMSVFCLWKVSGICSYPPMTFKLFAPPAHAVIAISTVGLVVWFLFFWVVGGVKSETIVWYSSQAPMRKWMGVTQGDIFQSIYISGYIRAHQKNVPNWYKSIRDFTGGGAFCLKYFTVDSEAFDVNQPSTLKCIRSFD